MKERLENIFDDIAETKHEIMCFTEVLNDYKEFCYLNDNTEWENKFIILIKIAESLYNDFEKKLNSFDEFIKTLPKGGKHNDD